VIAVLASLLFWLNAANAQAPAPADTLRELTELVASAADDAAAEELLAARLTDAIRMGSITPEEGDALVEQAMEFAAERLVKHLGRLAVIPDDVAAAPNAYVDAERHRSRRAERLADQAYRTAHRRSDSAAMRCVVQRLLQLQQLRAMEPALRRIYQQSSRGSSARDIVLGRLIVIDHLTQQRVTALRACPSRGRLRSPVPTTPCEADLAPPRYDSFTGEFIPAPGCPTD